MSNLLLVAALLAAAPQTITRERVMLAEDRRASGVGDYELLTAAAADRDPVMRALAIRALGRLEQVHASAASSGDLIQRALADRDPEVRRTAAYALAQSVASSAAAVRAPRRAALLAALNGERSDRVAGALMISAARLADASSIAEVETHLHSVPTGRERHDAFAHALELLARLARKPGVLSETSRSALLLLARSDDAGAAGRRAAVQALVTGGFVDDALAGSLSESPDWQSRRLVIASAGGNNAPPNAAAFIRRGLSDADWHVRHDAVRAYARRLKASQGCGPIFGAMNDASTHVVLAAIDALTGCGDPGIVSALASAAAAPGGVNWHRASHALVTLASLDRGRAGALVSSHAKDAAWPVRMYAARAAAALGNDDLLVQLSSDGHPNVREAALTGLGDRASAKDATDLAARQARLRTAIASALGERRDAQLVRTAARLVAASGDAPSLKAPLIKALREIEDAGADTWIDARVAIVEALKAAAPGESFASSAESRAPMTPSEQELRARPVRARIEMARGGSFELELLPDEAPATVARFARLARAGYFNGLTFHRVEPTFVVQGGSPWANEYSGAARFQRDEIGFARHERGAVGISTRGRDTGDAQIFIDLVDSPRLNHNYTVFARVVSGMDVVDQILEADVIFRVEVLNAR